MIDNTIDSITPFMREDAWFPSYTTRVLTADSTAERILKTHLSADKVAVQSNPRAELFGEIGRGTYGIIFERPGTLEVVKRPIRQSTRQENPHDLWNDFLMHRLIQGVFEKYPKVHVPRCLQYVLDLNVDWWSTFGTKFDDEYQSPSNLLFTERILPIPRSVREALVDHLCPEELRELSKSSNKNKHCLIHPLLGRRKGNPTLRAMLNLRNYELCVDQMERLGLDVDTIIDSMAESLAKLHWEAHIDAHDIEFVFGLAPTFMHSTLPPYEEIRDMPDNSNVTPFGSGMNLHSRIVHLWMLDFNKVSEIPGDDQFVEMALNGFVNQSKAYYPRPRFANPNVNDSKKWERFSEVYLGLSKVIRRGTNDNLPESFLEAVENYYRDANLRIIHQSWANEGGE